MADKTGLTIPAGGAHPLMGTHNLLMATGDDTFLEVIAINPTAPKPPHPSWFGLDDIWFRDAKPHSWVLNSDDFEADLAFAKSLGIDLGQPTALTRGDMTWQFAVRPDGAIPLDGAAPMMMAWPKMPTHPAAKMPDLGVRIKSATLHTPHAKMLNKLLNTIGNGKIPIKISESPHTKFTVMLTLNDGRDVVLD